MKGKKTKTTSNETAVTTPNLSPEISGAVNNYYTNVGELLADPTAAITPANQLQQDAWGGAQALNQNTLNLLGPARGVLADAQNSLGGITPVTAQQAALPGQYTPQQAALPGQYAVSQANLPAQYAPTQVANVEYGPIAQAAVATGQAAALPGMEKVDTSFLSGATGSTYGGASLLDNLDKYRNPFMNEVVDTTKADLLHEQAAQRAAYERQGALNNAFGGSNFAIGEAALMGDQNRAFGSTLANIRAQALRDAMTFSGQDADRRNAAGIASMQSGNSLLGQTLGYQMDAALANQKYNNEARMAGFDAANTFGIENMRGQNAANIANAGFVNTAQGDIYSNLGQNARANANAANDANSTFFNAGADLSKFNADQRNNANSQFYDTAADLGKFNTLQNNDASQNFWNGALDLSKFNTDQVNTTAMNNGNLMVNRANALANIGNMQGGLAMDQAGMIRDNINLMSDMGDNQYNYQQQYSPYSTLGAIGGLLDPSLIGSTTGQTIQSNGTSTSKESGGLLGGILSGAFGLGAAAIKKSERRVKRDIVKLGEEADGLGVYRYNYVWDEPHEMPRFGVMVDEVERIRPWALGPVVDGVQTVNYGAL